MGFIKYQRMMKGGKARKVVRRKVVKRSRYYAKYMRLYKYWLGKYRWAAGKVKYYRRYKKWRLVRYWSKWMRIYRIRFIKYQRMMKGGKARKVVRRKVVRRKV